MAFHGLSIIFDNIPSETYGLYLMSLGNSSGQATSDMGINMDIVTDKSAMSNVPYLYGAKEGKVLSFPITLSSKEPLDRYSTDAIQRWLFGHNAYKKLQIVQDDLRNVYFNCILNNPQAVTLGNLTYSIDCTVVCDSSYAWELPQTINYSIATKPQTVFFTNKSSVNDYSYPKLEFMCTKSGESGVLSIINETDSNREFKITGLRYGEVITVDNKLQIIKSSLGRNIVGNFNKKFFKLAPDLNKIIINGDIANLKMIHQNIRRVGG